MRQIVEAAKQRPTDDTDGIKVFHPPKGGSGASRPDDWVLVIPDTVEPVTHLWAESATVADADELADAYEALVRRAAEGE
jgi:phosphomannomutase